MPQRTYDYWCTWSTQGATAAAAGRSQRDQIALDLLIGPGGWLHDLDAEIRPYVLVVLDDGWDIPRGLDAKVGRRMLGAAEPDPGRFPDTGSNPVERLATINQHILDLGFAGTGLWIAAQGKEESRDQPWDMSQQEAYWTERLRWSQAAGISYWKIDWGVHWNDAEFRRMITRIARQVAPHVVIEHAVVMKALNDWDTEPTPTTPHRGSGRFTGAYAGLMRDLIGHADVIRTYDAAGSHAVAVTFDRVATLLTASTERLASTHVNVEGHPLLAAGLGMCAGIMKHPRHWRSGRRPQWDAVRRLMRWRQLAPPVPLGGTAFISDTTLTSESVTSRSRLDDGIAEVVDVPVRQIAPAIISRNMALPIVEPTSNQGSPFIAAVRHENGAVAIAALERHVEGLGEITPPARIQLTLDGWRGPLGIFGRFGSLRLHRCGDRPLLVRDLLAGNSIPLPSIFRKADQSLDIPGPWLEHVGLTAASPDDPSPPGLIIESLA